MPLESRFGSNHRDRIMCECSGDVFIDKTAEVDSSAVLGPNVTVGENVKIAAGVRVVNSIILPGAVLKVRIVLFTHYNTVDAA